MNKTKVKCHPEDDVQAYFASIIEHEVEQVLHWHPVAIKGIDPEGVHQLRVSLRRLMVACDVFGGTDKEHDLRTLKKQFKKHAKSLGEARDLDVYYLTNLSSHAEHDELRKIVLTQQSLAYQQVKKSLNQATYTSFFKAIKKTFAKGEKRLNSKVLFDYAQHNLNACYQQIVQLMSTDDMADDLVLHELRIYFKKLRYSFEFFRPLFDKLLSKSFNKQLKQVQDSLGEIHDCFVLQQMHQGLLSDPETPIKAILQAKRIERHQFGVATALKAQLPMQLTVICEHDKPWLVDV